MTLATRVMHVPAGLPIDESTRLELVDVGTSNRAAVNVRQEEPGSLNKRLGYDALAYAYIDGSLRSAGRRMLSSDDRICVIDGDILDDYSPALNCCVSRGRVPEASVTTRPTTSYAAEVGYTALLDCCVVGNYVVYAHTTSEAATLGTGSLVLTVEDRATGVVLRVPEVIFTADPIAFGTVVCALTSYSTYAIAIYFDHTTALIAAAYLDTSTAATIAAGWVNIGYVAFDKVVPGGLNLGIVALSAQSLTNRVAFAYVNDSGGASQVTVKTITIGGVAEAVAVNTSSATPSCVAVEGSIADTLWVAWDETTSVKIKGLDADVLATTLATTATMLTLATVQPAAIGVVSGSTTGKGRILATDGGNDRIQMRGFQSSGAVTADGAQVTVPNAFLGGRPFRVGTRYYATFAPAPGNVNNVQQACILCDFTEDQSWLRPIANIAPSLATMAMATHVESVGSSQYVFPVMVATSGAARATVLVTLDFADHNRWHSVKHNGATFLSGGLLSYLDGVRVAESGFVVRPPKPTTSAAGTGITGSFRYVLVYEEVDSNGNWCVSSISDPSAVRVVSNKTITVTLRPCSITGRQRRAGGSEVRMALYRTGVTGEGTYYRLTTVPNDTSAVTTTYADATADVTANVQLYSATLPGSGSAQDRRAPPFCQAIASFNGMLVVASGSDLWWSGQAVSGEGTWFNPAFVVPIEGQGGITAIASQDGTLYVFTRSNVYAVAGEAPSDNGASGGLGTPRRLAGDMGCINADSVVVTSLGVFFESERGLELLNRGGSVEPIGAPIAATLAAFPIISSAVIDRRNSLARFSLAESRTAGVVGGNGRDLVYDLTLRRWVSTDIKRGSSAAEASQDAVVVLIGGVWRYAWLGTDGIVHYERLATDGQAHLDGTHWIASQWELPPWKLGLQQEQRVFEMMILFQRNTAAGLTIEVANDYGAYGATTADEVWTESATLGQRQLPFRPKPRGIAIGLRVTETAPDDDNFGTGKGFTFIGLSADIAPKQGPTRGTPRLAVAGRR